MNNNFKRSQVPNNFSPSNQTQSPSAQPILQKDISKFECMANQGLFPITSDRNYSKSSNRGQPNAGTLSSNDYDRIIELDIGSTNRVDQSPQKKQSILSGQDYTSNFAR